MPDFIDWHDFVRVLVIAVCIYGAVTLVIRFRRNSDSWNEKTKDYWYALFMWTLAGIAAAAQGIALDRPFTPAFVFITAAALVTGRGIHRKGGWGGDS